MPGSTVTSSFQVQDAVGARGLSMVGPNARVRGTLGRLGTQLDTVLFNTPITTSGNWAFANTRVRIQGVPSVGQSSIGVTTPGPSSPSPGTMFVVGADTRIKST